jgi:hypothetical protein
MGTPAFVRRVTKTCRTLGAAITASSTVRFSGMVFPPRSP